MLERITPVILTYNEEANIERVLERLRWARDIVVMDSYSTDGTLSILERYPNVRCFQRKFDSHANQWNFAITQTGIETDWILALDADYVLTEKLVDELGSLAFNREVKGYSASFLYCVFGKPLRGSLYPAVTVLYNKNFAAYVQDGHTQRIQIEGKVGSLKAEILHDDRKPLSSWLRAQDKYMDLEADIISQSEFGSLGFNDCVRKLILPGPILTFFYCLLYKKGILDGWAGLFYATQRTVAEFILSMKLIQRKIALKEIK